MDKMVLHIPFLLFIGGKTTSVSEATDVFDELIRGFTWMYMDILQLIDHASLGHGVIHCGGEVFKECSSTFLLIFMVSFSCTLRFPLFMLPLASGAKEVEQVLKPGTIIGGLPSFLEDITSFPLICRRDRNPHTVWLSANQNVGGFNASVGALGLEGLS